MAKCVWFMRCGLGILMHTFTSAQKCDRPNIPGITGNAGKNFVCTKGFYKDGSHLMMCAARCLALGPTSCLLPGKNVSTHSHPLTIWPQRLKFSYIQLRKNSYKRTRKTKPTTSAVVTSGTTMTTRKLESIRKVAQKKLKSYCNKSHKNGFRFHKEGSDAMCLALKNGSPEMFPLAKQKCNRYKARLAVADTKMKIKLMNKFLKTENERNWLQAFNQKSYRMWIGLRGNSWVDGTGVIDAKFANVTIEHDKELCVSVKVAEFTWKYEKCAVYNFYICELA